MDAHVRPVAPGNSGDQYPNTRLDLAALGGAPAGVMVFRRPANVAAGGGGGADVNGGVAPDSAVT